MLEEQPVQSIRRDVEALKIAFYRIRRSEVEAARRRFLEEGGAEEDFAPAVDGAEVRSRSLSRSTAAAATSSSPTSKPKRKPISRSNSRLSRN